jgi:branched-chain amino acid transport system substrate-binding protein
MHYLAAVKATSTTDGPTVVREMKAISVNDFMTKNGHIREDGTLVGDIYLFEVKSQSESRDPWDYHKQIAVIPGEEAFNPLGPNECDMTRSFAQ